MTIWKQHDLEEYQQLVLTATGRKLSIKEAKSSATNMYNLFDCLIK